MKKLAALLVGAVLLLGACATTPPAEQKTVTVTAAVPVPTTAPVVTSSPVAPAPAPVGEDKACALLHRAQGLPTYSGRWDSVMYDAEDAAVSDAMYNAIVKSADAIWNTDGYNYEAIAERALASALKKFCLSPASSS